MGEWRCGRAGRGLIMLGKVISSMGEIGRLSSCDYYCVSHHIMTLNNAVNGIIGRRPGMWWHFFIDKSPERTRQYLNLRY